jgi:hypothetical protein
MLKALEAVPATPQALTLLARSLPATLAPRYVLFFLIIAALRLWGFEKSSPLTSPASFWFFLHLFTLPTTPYSI